MVWDRRAKEFDPREDFERSVENARRVQAESRGDNSRGNKDKLNLQLGKSVNILLPVQQTQTGFADICWVGPIDEPRQWTVTIAPPEFIQFANPGAVPPDLSVVNSTLTNIALLPANQPDLHLANVAIELEWGVGSVVQRATVDALNGLAINLTASYVIVRGAVQAPDGGGGIDTSMVYKIGAHIGPGNNSGGRARLTLNQLVAANQAAGFETPVLAVPRFARSVTVYGMTAFDDIFTGQLKLWRSKGGAADDRRVAEIFFSANDPQPIAIPNGSYYFSCLTGIASTVAGLWINYVFDLAI